MRTKQKDLLERIAWLEGSELDEVILAIRARYQELHSDTELIVASVPKNDRQERSAFWQWLIRYVRDHEMDVDL